MQALINSDVYFLFVYRYFPMSFFTFLHLMIAQVFALLIITYLWIFQFPSTIDLLLTYYYVVFEFSL